MKKLIIERTAKTGQKIEIFVEFTETSSPSITSYLDGKNLSRLCSLGGDRKNLPSPYVNSIGKIGITLEERILIEAELKNAEILWKSSTPSGLRSQRENLVYEIKACSEIASEMRTKNFHKNDSGEGMGINEMDKKEAAAREALKAFDEAHPEVKAKIISEKNEEAARFSRSN